MKSILLVKKFLGLIEMTSGLLNASFSLPEWQAVKMIFFAPCIGLKIIRLTNFNMLFQLVLIKFFQNALFSCLPKVDNMIKPCKEPIKLSTGWRFIHWIALSTFSTTEARSQLFKSWITLSII